MSKLDDIFGDDNSSPEGQEIDIEMSCPECGLSAEKVVYIKSNKHVATKCSDGHEVEVEMDLSWLIR